jgi:ATP-dependent DNA helicase 2 subunit 1
MHNKKKIAIARFTRLESSIPYFVALLPQLEEFDEDGTQLTPPGLHVIYLPYADDIRQLTLPKTISASKEQVDKAKAFVKKIRIRFDSRSFENPVLQKHYASLQALALEREQLESVPDYVKPDLEGMAHVRFFFFVFQVTL